MKSFAIVLICFERLEGLQRILSSLVDVDYNNRKDITLIFSIDYAKDNENVRTFANNYKWLHGEKKVRAFSENQGLKMHILGCGNLTESYDVLVVLEDDIYVSKSMYHYAYHAANFYMDDDNIAGISLYSFDKNWLNTLYDFIPQKNEYDVFFLKIAQSWGQVWTTKKWRKFKEWYHDNEEFTYSKFLPLPLIDWSSKSSWLKYFDRYCIEKDKYFVYPYFSISTNFSDAGTHSFISSNDSQVRLMGLKKNYLFPEFSIGEVFYDEFMERERLEEYLNIPENSLTVDIFRNKPDCMYKDYLLSTRKLDYTIVNEYSLCVKPAEMSIIDNLIGKGIYLYNTKVSAKNKNKDDKFLLLRYSLGVSSIRKYINLLKFSIKGIISNILSRIFKK